MKKVTLKTAVAIAAVLLVGFALQAADTYSQTGNGVMVVNSQIGAPTSTAGGYGSAQWGTNAVTGAFATNGLYPIYTTGGATLITNAVRLSPVGNTGNQLAIQFSGSYNGVATAGITTNTMVFTLASAVRNPTLITTNTFGGYVFSTATPVQTYTTVSLPLGGIGTPTTTNVLFNPQTTPTFNGALDVYLLGIACPTMTNPTVPTVVATNYSIIVQQVQ